VKTIIQAYLSSQNRRTTSLELIYDILVIRQTR